MKDAYTYFVASDDSDKLTVEKLHLCSWLYRKPWWALPLCGLYKSRELLEIGLQIKVNEREHHKLKRIDAHHKGITFSILVPWLKVGATIKDVFPQMKDTRNARFIFNTDVDPRGSCDGGEGNAGVFFKFGDSPDPMCLLPVEGKIKEDGVLTVNVAIPDKVKLHKNPIYVRMVITIPRTKFCCKNSCITKTRYMYDVKVNEPRNYPKPEEQDKICSVETCYCIHIVPSNFHISFNVAKAFRNVRILEHERYNSYVKGLGSFVTNIQANDYLVIFNKIDNSVIGSETEKSPFSFFTVLEKEHIGRTSVLVATIINILCTIACTLLFASKGTISQSWVYKKFFINATSQVGSGGE